jgi:hypothetical protein
LTANTYEIRAKRDGYLDYGPVQIAVGKSAETVLRMKMNVKAAVPPPVDPLIAAAAREQGEWSRISAGSDATAVEDFLRRYPASSHSAAAADKLEQIRWDGVDKTSAVALEAFATQYQQGGKSTRARELLGNLQRIELVRADQRDWGEVDKNSREGLADFLTRHSGSDFAGTARERLAELDAKTKVVELARVDDAAWSLVDAKNQGSIQDYAQRFPSGKHSEQAAQALANLRALEVAEVTSAIGAVLERYASAWTAKDVAGITSLHRSLDKRAIKAQLAPVSTIRMTIVPASPPQISGERATVVCRRQVEETFSDGTEKQSPEALVTFLLSRRGGQWIIDGTRW